MKRLAKRLLRSDLPLPSVARPAIRFLHRCCILVRESFILTKKWLIVSPLVRSTAECGKGLSVERVPYIRGRGQFVIGNDVTLSGKSNFRFLNQAISEPSLQIGSDVFIGNGCVFAVAERIEIGSHSMIAGGVTIRDNDGHPADPEARKRQEPLSAKDTAAVVLGTNVWIGTGATVLKGVTIGDNAIVGSQSVVTQDVGANTVVVGNPARVVKRLTIADPSPEGGEDAFSGQLGSIGGERLGLEDGADLAAKSG